MLKVSENTSQAFWGSHNRYHPVIFPGRKFEQYNCLSYVLL